MNNSRFVAALLVCVCAGAAVGQTSSTPDSARKPDSSAVPQPATLPRVTVQGRVVTYPPRYEAAYKRAASGRGYYITREEIEATNPRDVETLLQHVPTLQIDDRGITFAKCQAGLPSPMEMEAPPPSARVAVYIDGRRATASSDEGIRDILGSIPVSSIQLMEIYTGQSRIPGDFFSDACAAIAIWTKSY